MDKSDNERISRRVGWNNEAKNPYFYGRTWKQKVLRDKRMRKQSLSISLQGTKIAVKTIGTLSMIALFIWQVSSHLILTYNELRLRRQVLVLCGWIHWTLNPVFAFSPWFCNEGKPCCGQVCQQADQPPRKAPGFLPISFNFFQQYLRKPIAFILQGLRYIALPKCHILPEIHLENLSWGDQDYCQISLCRFKSHGNLFTMSKYHPRFINEGYGND